MRTKFLLQTTGLAIAMIVLTILYSNAQIPFQGLHVNHEGAAGWDADGTGPEPAAAGHPHPFGWNTSTYYGASRDYDGIDPDPDAALGHVLNNINGFPLFQQALTSHGFTPGQVKVKLGMINEKSDQEGEDWFTFNNHHYINKYDGNYYIELDGEPMITCHVSNMFFTYDAAVNNRWQFESDFSRPVNSSAGSSAQVQAVAAAFFQDMNIEELRMTGEMETAGTTFSGNGRNGFYFNILSGNLEKGQPELPFTGFETDHEGIAAWDADGTGPEPQGYGHTFTYNGVNWWMAYYIASRDYDDIDPDSEAALCHFYEAGTGFPNLAIQLAYRGYSIDQLKIKSGLSNLGNNIEGIDWGLIGSTHWYHHYGNVVTLEIAGEPILEYEIDTNYGSRDVGTINYDWTTHSSPSTITDISVNASANAQHVASSFLKDLSGHSMKTYMDGQGVSGNINTNGRDGVFHEITSGELKPELPFGTLVWDHEVSGTWYLANSPYIVMGYIKIQDGETLTIEPGAVVKFNSTERFDIQGCLNAEGTEALPILFTAVDPDVRWGGMVWDQTPATNPNSVLNYCVFEYSYAYGTELGYNCGGAIRINMVDNIGITHCVFRYNGADLFTTNNPAGGAIALFESSIHISHSIFHDNTGSWAGAVMTGSNSNPVIDNCLFYNNESTYPGGGGGAGISWENSSPHFVNCTFADNHSVSGGGAYDLELGGITTFTNCIFWGNTADVGANQIGVWMENPVPVLNVYYSDVEDGENGITPGFQGEYLYNLDADPYFIGSGNHPYALNLDPLSPCIDEGTLDPLYLPLGWSCPACCLCGNPRVSGSGIDLGCYEAIEVGMNESIDLDEFSLKIFPNPINSPSTIEFYLDIEMPVQFSILDIHGRTIAELTYSNPDKGVNRLTWNDKTLIPGVYFCRIQCGNKMTTKKLVKSNYQDR